MTSVPFDRVADRYDASRGGAERGERTAAVLAPWLVPGTVLEVGVGTGVVAAALTAAGHPTFGVDLAAPMLARAYDRVGPRLARADARALPVRSAAVADVVFVAALHVIRDVHAALAEAARVARPGGRILAVHGSPVRESTDDLADALALLKPLSADRPDSPDAVDAAAAALGLRPLAATLAARASFAPTPAEAAAAIEDRLWSYLWDLDDDAWMGHVVPALDRLRALPDQHRPRPYADRMRLAVFERP